jgi:arabinofuranan 3-O-arabinosyltransferase
VTAPSVTTATGRRVDLARGVPALVERARTLTCLLVLWTVAFAQSPGKVVADTKIDLALDPWGLMSRALHLWDPATSFGVLQNQGYGYLFPMGPFAALGQLVAPPWVVQRLWWGVLLTIGFLAMRALLKAWQVADPITRQVAALAFALSPRVVSTLGPISSESAPALLVPAILLPVVLAARGEIGARRAAALSALAVLGCGGVNATATALAVVPAGLFLLTRRAWWRAPVTWWWAGSVVAATAWWAVPLVLLGRYSPPFLDWIESSDTVTSNISLLDDLRGTSHWLGHLVTQAGPWWNAGYDLVADRGLIVATAVAAGLGLAGLSSRSVPHRGYLVTCAVLGVLILGLPHAGALASPLSPLSQDLLDGPLAPLRNVHKADPLLRLPVVVGFAHLLGQVSTNRWRVPWLSAGSSRGARIVAVVTMTATALSPILPALGGQLPSRGSFASVPKEWSRAGSWLDQQPGGGTALVVPASNFDEYTWGRPLDLVLRSQTTNGTAVRDAVPLTPPNTIRMLDSVETRLQTGRDLGGVVDVLHSAGVRFLVLRNDLDTTSTRGVPSSVARSSISSTAGVRLAAAFGDTFVDGNSDRVRPVEVYRLPGAATEAAATLTPLSDVVSASGASDSLADLRDAGVDRPVVFDGDAVTSAARAIATHGMRVVTDGMRARNRAFGSIRGRDVTQTLSAREAAGSLRDYLPWVGPQWRTTVSYTGLSALTASGSLATDAGPGGLDPSDRPFSAVDRLSTTAWVVSAEGRPSLTMTFDHARAVQGLEVSPLADTARFGDFLGIATRLRVTTDAGHVEVPLGASGRLQTVAGLPAAPTTHLRIEIVSTSGGSDALVTGLAEVRVPGLVVRESAVVAGVDGASSATGGSAPQAADLYVLSEQFRGNDGCVDVRTTYVCRGDRRSPEDAAGLDRTLPVADGVPYAVRGTLGAVPGPGLDAVLDIGAAGQVTASSRLSRAPQARPGAVLDGDPATAWAPDPADATPTLAVTFPRPVEIQRLQLHTRGEWLTGRDVTAQVTVDGRVQLADVLQDGSFTIEAATGRNLRVRLLLAATRQDADRDSKPATGMEVSELSVDGVPTPAAPERITAGCGNGPTLLVEGVSIPTRVTGPRSAAFGDGELRFESCRPASMSAPDGRVAVEPWGGFVPEHMDLTRSDTTIAPTAPARAATVASASASRVEVSVGRGEAALLALPQNANPGWQATLDGRRLESVTVDGWKQGFVVPQGAGGQVRIVFGPDSLYRWGLLVGLALVLLVGASAMWRSSRRAAPLAAASVPAALAVPTALVLGFVLAGSWGLVVAAVCAAASVLVRHRLRWGLTTGVAGLVAVAGVLQAALAPGRLGEPGLEGTVRLLCVAAVVLVVSASWRSARPGVHPGHQRTLHQPLGEGGQTQGHRHAHSQQGDRATGEVVDTGQ